MDSISETRLASVHPQLAKLVRQMSEQLEAEGVAIRVVQALRTWDEQAALYAQGRTTPGNIVTNAQPGHGWHEFGCAIDLVPSQFAPDKPYSPDWNAEHPSWKRMIEIGTSLGLFAGANFRSFKDNPHFQLTGDLPVSPTDAVRQAYADAGGGDAGIKAVWAMTGLPMDVVS